VKRVFGEKGTGEKKLPEEFFGVAAMETKLVFHLDYHSVA
jgi:hypothetical protein